MKLTDFKLIATLSLLTGVLLTSVLPVFAQTSPSVTPGQMSSGVGITVNLTDKNAPDGSIVSFSSDGYHLSRVAYDPTVFGVISDSTSVTLEDPDQSDSQSRIVLTEGKVAMRVSTQNGPIKAGNLLATSNTPGVGQLATVDGYVLGTALEDYTVSDPSKIGTIFVSLNLGFNSQSTILHKDLISNIKTSLTSPFLTPVNTFRYILAGMAVLVGLGIGLFHFGRSTSGGIEALGRNPLARNAILLSMIANLLLTLVAMGVGLAIAYFILSL